MRRFMLPFLLLGLMLSSLFAGTASARTVVVFGYPYHAWYYNPWYWGAGVYSPQYYAPVDPKALDQLRSQYESAKTEYKQADDRWDAIKDACKGKAKDVAVDRNECDSVKATRDTAKDTYQNA